MGVVLHLIGVGAKFLTNLNLLPAERVICLITEEV